MRVVVEPHADDAYLSLHNHIKTWVSEGDKVVILTVCSGTRKRKADAQAYADSVKATSIGLGFEEGFGGPILIKQALPVLFEPEDVQWYIPLGLQNPDHIAVRQMCDLHLEWQDDVAYYAEIPYYTKKKNKEEFLQAISKMSLNSIEALSGRKADEKYWKCFKDQSKFFYFNKPEDMARIPEFTFIKS
jgi:hypothetical protein